MLNVEGDLERVKSLLSPLQLHLEAQWNQGDTDRSGRIYAAGGVRAVIADTATANELLSSVRAFLDTCEGRGVSFLGKEVAAHISIGIGVGEPGRYTASVDFSGADTLRLGRFGLGLSVTAYPISEEGDE